MEKVIVNLLETAAAAVLCCFVLSKFQAFLLAISCY